MLSSERIKNTRQLPYKVVERNWALSFHEQILPNDERIITQASQSM